ncbi:hypothetical protein B0T10DRAFT_611888 [Thelonectria olida]|uniref:C2H2-type domain-containing protein n=1 Tax=Thelonectria olida TaxID=1576542 RepID=A0A9P8VPW6_9HYPO|nr:hypothetical protein B0T10DRAFT_611888 [Thelonectria olida]
MACWEFVTDDGITYVEVERDNSIPVLAIAPARLKPDTMPDKKAEQHASGPISLESPNGPKTEAKHYNIHDAGVVNIGTTQTLSCNALSLPREQMPLVSSAVDPLSQSEDQARPRSDDSSVVSPTPNLLGAKPNPSSSGDEISFTQSVPTKRVATQAQAKRTRPKRNQTTTIHGNGYEDGDGDPWSSGDEFSGNKPKDGNAFACPFYRRDPIRYFDCVNRKLNRIQDLKQHLIRRHTAPHSCTSCFRGFSTSQLLENHVLDGRCESESNIHGVSPTARKLLKDRIERKLSPEDQWHKIWKILFGYSDIMQNPHLESVVEEVFGIVRGFYEKDGHKIVAGFVKSRGLPSENIGLLHPLLMELLDSTQTNVKQGPNEPTTREAPAIFTENKSNSTATSTERQPVLEPPPFISEKLDSYESPDVVLPKDSRPASNFSGESGPSINDSEQSDTLPLFPVSDFSFECLTKDLSPDWLLADLMLSNPSYDSGCLRSEGHGPLVFDAEEFHNSPPLDVEDFGNYS